MNTEVSIKEKYSHPTYTNEEIEALLKYFQCEGLELRPFLDRFEY